MPRQGQSVESCIINEWRVKEGDRIEAGEPICDIETDKATFEVEAPASGTVLGIFYPVESDVEVLKVIAAIGEPGEDISALRPDEEGREVEEVPEVEGNTGEPPAPVQLAEVSPPPAGSSAPGASPRAKNLARDKGVDIAAIAGTGPHGRVIERDVVAARPAAVSPAALERAAKDGLGVPATGSGVGGRVLAADLAAGTAPVGAGVPEEFPGNVTEVPVRGVRALIADRMHASLQNSAQLTHHSSADARAVLAYRKKCKAAPGEAGVSGISINDAVLYVTVKTLAEFPELNAHWGGDRIVQFGNVHLGLAVDTPRGLIVPVIRYANLMNLKQLSAEAKRLARDCIEGNVDPDTLIGGTFTVSTLGALGIEAFTPVLNTPEVGILGVCNIRPKAVMAGDEVEFIPHMGLSLTFDHRAVDGAPAARFLASLGRKLADFELTLAG
ncbi:MAG: dihydrolipoamide acetyltransferase family protein [Lysobacterales bacterium]|jgi:pyruvate dehydrogenase E2 component (dihydrolipoamide acetyltransferase)